MNWRKARGEEIDTLPPGTHVVVDGVEYIRMVDSPSNHMEGCLFDPLTGGWIRWTKLVLRDEEVEVPDDLC